ncbi:hypothetical protein GUITHDRAFT_150213, partial [Guillardia theta CCMP2712]
MEPLQEDPVSSPGLASDCLQSRLSVDQFHSQCPYLVAILQKWPYQVFLSLPPYLSSIMHTAFAAVDE